MSYNARSDVEYSMLVPEQPQGYQAKESAWLHEQNAKSQRSKWIVTAVGFLALIGIGVGIGVGVSVANKSNNAAVVVNNGTSSAAAGSTTTSSSAPNPSGGVTNSDPNDPSNFQKNAAFHKVFWGMAYTPNGSIMPNCGATQAEVITDIQIMSQLTDTVRLYGADCNVTALVLNAIKLTKVDMKVYIANYISPDDKVAYTRQKAIIEDALKTYGVDNIVGLTVGNEQILQAAQAQHTEDPNSELVKPVADYIIESINDTRSSLKALGYNNIKVGTSEAGYYFNTEVLKVCEYGLSNFHAWFAETKVSDAVQWVWTNFKEENVDKAALLTNQPEMIIAETGWPTGSKTTADARLNITGGEASAANLQVFLDNFVCQSNTQGVKYFYFELFDEMWKDALYGGVEGYWGILDKDKNLKPGITIPTCQ
ncbi:glycoside hydrolase [Auriculariales sp. MPI-PUGE-AT-0066]|nr:glycoside hydrolase [Auriculariales sp. MPI-PUGE-AT-0066]